MTRGREFWVGLASVAFLLILAEVFMVRPMNRHERLAAHCERAYETARTRADTARIDREVYYYGSRSSKGATCASVRLRSQPDQIKADSAQRLPQYFVRKASR